MADHIPVNGSVKRNIETPLTLTALQILVGGFIRFVELSSGDWMVINEASLEGTLEGTSFLNPTASQLAGKSGPIYGDAVICDPKEIA